MSFRYGKKKLKQKGFNRWVELKDKSYSGRVFHTQVQERHRLEHGFLNVSQTEGAFNPTKQARLTKLKNLWLYDHAYNPHNSPKRDAKRADHRKRNHYTVEPKNANRK